MKRGFTGFIVGVLVTTMLTGVAYAGGVTKTIKAVFNSVNIAVNGQKVSADNILYNGTTYVPLRAVSEALGKDVVWDKGTNTANINDKGGGTSTPSTPSKPETPGFSRTNPAPKGVTQRITVDNYVEQYTAEVTVTEVLRGKKAWEKIEEANMFNSEPAADEEYILAKIKIKAVEVKDDKSISISGASFDCYSGNNVEYNDYSVVVPPDPSLTTDLYSGGEHEGYIVFTVKKSDTSPKIAFGLKYDGTGGIWFKLQ